MSLLPSKIADFSFQSYITYSIGKVVIKWPDMAMIVNGFGAIIFSTFSYWIFKKTSGEQNRLKICILGEMTNLKKNKTFIIHYIALSIFGNRCEIYFVDGCDFGSYKYI